MTLNPRNVTPTSRRRRWTLVGALAVLLVGAVVVGRAAAAPGDDRAALTPEDITEKIDRMTDRLADRLDATDAQRDTIRTILTQRASAIVNLRNEGRALKRSLREAVLAAPRPDPARIETLRAEGIQLADRASKLLTATVLEISDVLTDAQRADLREKIAWLWDLHERHSH